MPLVELIRGKDTGDEAIARAFDFTRRLRKTPIVVNDSRGFYANRCVGAFILEGHLMLVEGVPPAMIENAARMAGMPVGPLSLTDEVAIDLIWKIMQSAIQDVGEEAADPRQRALLDTMVNRHGRLGRKNSKGFYDYLEGGSKRLWPGLSEFAKNRLDPDAVDVEDLKRRFLATQALEAARNFFRGGRDGCARSGRRLHPRFRLRPVYGRRPQLYRRDRRGGICFAVRGSRKKIWAALRSQRSPHGDGEARRLFLFTRAARVAQDSEQSAADSQTTRNSRMKTVCGRRAPELCRIFVFMENGKSHSRHAVSSRAGGGPCQGSKTGGGLLRRPPLTRPRRAASNGFISIELQTFREDTSAGALRPLRLMCDSAEDFRQNHAFE